jgi:hypothetical protein
MLTNEGRCTCEIKSGIAIATAAFNNNRARFTNRRKKLVKCYIALYGA